MKIEEDIDEVVSRVLAPNASHMTLDGTNTYVVGAPGSGEAVVVDPGPDVTDHRRGVEAVLARRDLACVAVLVTHHHLDHCEAAQAWGHHFGCPVAAPTAEVAGPDGRVLADGDRVEAGFGLRIEAVATPGHCADHTAYRLPTGAMLTGDHILGRGTSVVAWPEGELLSYLDSLHKVLALGPDALLPGHGPPMVGGDPLDVVRFYLEHRAYREAQVLAELAKGPVDACGLVRRIYSGVDERLWPAAELSTRATLHKLGQAGQVIARPDGTFTC